jgi:membrane protein implicated in regulation of membrane protease activity
MRIISSPSIRLPGAGRLWATYLKMKTWLGLFLVLTVLSAVNARAQQRELRHERSREERRIALVIGNSAYTIGPLKNPVNDARAMTQALREVGSPAHDWPP